MNLLITGATGFLGNHLIDYYRKNSGVKLILTGRNECKLALLKNKEYSPTIPSFYCGDILDKDFLRNIFIEEEIDVVIHAAAMKRIDICQENPIEAYKVNVVGTENILSLCKEFCANLLFVSTDKACNPCTTYGATKYLAEQIVRRSSEKSHSFIGNVVRYGNVLDSTGSVFSIWRESFNKTGKVMVRDINMTRFFWPAFEAVKFIDDVLIKKETAPGDIHIPDINSVNIYDAACYLYGKENVTIGKMTHNEKIHEEMSGNVTSDKYVIDPYLMFEGMDLGGIHERDNT